MVPVREDLAQEEGVAHVVAVAPAATVYAPHVGQRYHIPLVYHVTLLHVPSVVQGW